MSNSQKIRTAILPVAGMGTRFLPATKAQPKEMLPIVDTPVIQFLVEEAVHSGIHQIIFVTGKGKRAIEDHFDSSPELEHILIEKGKAEIAEQLRGISNLASFAYVRQKEPRGDGDAILSAAHLIGDEPVAILFGDNLVFSEEPCLAQMMHTFDTYGEPTVALERVPDEKVSLYGIVEGEEVSERTYRISHVIEKPQPTETSSRLAAMGKYIITPDIFTRLRELQPDKGGEIRLADALQSHLVAGGSVYGLEFLGHHFDCGSKLGFLQATVEKGLQHAETKDAFAAYLKERMNKLQ
jgi:UTP--glucose-1-phosphate uridylyltransferase